MQRMVPLWYIEEKVNNSNYFESEKDKKEVIAMYKKGITRWLDELKEKLNNYQPIFTDLETRRSVSPSFNYSEHNLKGEIWKTYPLDNNYSVSNLGRIKYKGKIQKQKDDKIQYVTLADENLRKDYTYNFVAYTFLGKKEGDGFQIHHITNDGYYNTEENLVLLTKEEHSYIHGFEVGG